MITIRPSAMLSFFHSTSQSGQLILEALIGMAIFLLIVSVSIASILGALTSSRLAEEQTQATFFASQGLEAVKSIQNRNFSALQPGTYGLTKAGGVWQFAGTSDSVGPGSKYTRTITITVVNRDAEGNISPSGGIQDAETRNVRSTVERDFTPARHNSVVLETYLTDWQFTSVPLLKPITSCLNFCQSIGYTTAACRNNVSQCNQNAETNESFGNRYCTVNPTTTCCCKP